MMLTQQPRFLLLGVFYICAILVKINQEIRPWECTQRDRYTDTNRFYNLSHDICYSYEADKNQPRILQFGKLELQPYWQLYKTVSWEMKSCHTTCTKYTLFYN